MRIDRVGRTATTVCAVAGLVGFVSAQDRQVNISGATLFADFFKAPASTNDFVDVDGDGFHGYDPFNFPYVDQLAPSVSGCVVPTDWWRVHYRGVGSGNGLAELVNFQCSGAIPTSIPTDIGYLNRYKFAELGVVTGTCPPANASGVPVAPTSVDMAVMDVPTPWFVVAGSASEARWYRLPTQSGYGRNPVKSWNNPAQGNTLKSLGCLNLNTAAPDAHTVFDTQVAWVPIALIANRGTGLQNVRATELQHLFVTGRLPSGENLVACTRDAGSGTRNGAMNSLCIDPSFGRGDNLGAKNGTAAITLASPAFQPTNLDSSGIMEDVVKNCRLGVGYTGLAGGSRAVGDAAAGKYEILNVMFDTHGGNVFVRPTIASVLDNLDPNSGYPIGGNETFATVGDPVVTDPNSPAYMTNQHAAAYLRNITQSIAATIAVPGGDQSYFMPGEMLAKDFFLAAAVDGLPSLTNPCLVEPNPALNQGLQNWTRANNGMGIGSDTPAYGSVNVANKVPVRASGNISWPTAETTCDCAYPPNGQYSDGSTTGAYVNRHTGATIAGGGDLNARNRLAGDFNGDGLRNINDVETMMAALYDPNAYVRANSSTGDPIVPEIIGDFNGDGNFDCRDVRYFCDGLALDPATGKLDRAAAFRRVDEKWAVLTGGDNNFFNTSIVGADGQPRAYVAGAAAGDVAGNTAWPGAAPHGYDCVVNCVDALYVDGQFGDFANLDDAVRMDLSADLSGDLVVDCDDLAVIQELLGGACAGLVHTCTPVLCAGDGNCDGAINWRDIDFLIAAQNDNASGWLALFGTAPTCQFLNLDTNLDGHVNWRDIDPFIALMNTTCP
jgi:hypothetical protein